MKSKLILKMAFTKWGRYRYRYYLLIVIFALGVFFRYRMRDTVKMEQKDVKLAIRARLQEALLKEKGSGCKIPDLDPFASVMLQHDAPVHKLNCKKNDWVRCWKNTCSLRPAIKPLYESVQCKYRDMIYHNDDRRTLGTETVVVGVENYTLVASDGAKVVCEGLKRNGFIDQWKGDVVGLREVPLRPKPAGNSKEGHNVLIFIFDSVARNTFIRKMPISYKVLTEELGAVILKGYNIVGDGTAHALIPMFTGYHEFELPDIRQKKPKPEHYPDELPLIWYQLWDKGYKTAYMEDMPHVGTFNYRFSGFRKAPADYYIRPYLLEVRADVTNEWYCAGDTPVYLKLIELTEQLWEAPRGKQFSLTFSADLSHDDINLLKIADEEFSFFLKRFHKSPLMKNTVLIVMGDHGHRFSKVRNTLQGKQEERLPLMSFVLPESFRRAWPNAESNLRKNAHVLTTPFDMHATLLDLTGLSQFRSPSIVPGADLPRSMSLFEEIPPTRSCSEAGVEPHWCTCLQWTPVQESDPMYQLVVAALVDYINQITSSFRDKCALRTLTRVDSVTKSAANSNLLAFRISLDYDGYLGRYDSKTKHDRILYEVKIEVGPGNGIFEAALTHDVASNEIKTKLDDISRISMYGNEPNCVVDVVPELSKFCYCKNLLEPDEGHSSLIAQ